MKYGEADENGSFSARGSGIYYVYSASDTTLRIYRAGKPEPLLQVPFDQRDNPLKVAGLYARFFEKIACISALKYSAHKTTDLTEIFDGPEVAALAAGMGRLADYAVVLRLEDFALFQMHFVAENRLKNLEIKKIARTPHSYFYNASIETQSCSRATVRASSLPSLLQNLSERISRDILAREYGCAPDAAVQSLLAVSLALSTLSLTLNDRFVPSERRDSDVMSLIASSVFDQESLF